MHIWGKIIMVHCCSVIWWSPSFTHTHTHSSPVTCALIYLFFLIIFPCSFAVFKGLGFFFFLVFHTFTTICRNTEWVTRCITLWLIPCWVHSRYINSISLFSCISHRKISKKGAGLNMINRSLHSKVIHVYQLFCVCCHLVAHYWFAACERGCLYRSRLSFLSVNKFGWWSFYQPSNGGWNRISMNELNGPLRTAAI